MLISGVVSKKYALDAFRTAVKSSNGGEEGVPPTVESTAVTPGAPGVLSLVPSTAQTSNIELTALDPSSDRGEPFHATGQNSRAVVWKVDLGGGDLHSLCAAAQAVLERNFVSEAPSEYVEAGSRYEVDWERWEQVSCRRYPGFG